MENQEQMDGLCGEEIVYYIRLSIWLRLHLIPPCNGTGEMWDQDQELVAVKWV